MSNSCLSAAMVGTVTPAALRCTACCCSAWLEGTVIAPSPAALRSLFLALAPCGGASVGLGTLGGRTTRGRAGTAQTMEERASLGVGCSTPARSSSVAKDSRLWLACVVYTNVH